MRSPLPRPKRLAAVALVLTGAALLAACSSSSSPSAAGGASTSTPGSGSPVPSTFPPTTVTLLAHDSFALSKDLLEDFRRRTGITIKVSTGGDAGELVNKAALTAGNPEGDVLFGVDNTLLGRAAAADVFDAYQSPAVADVPRPLLDGTAGLVTPIDYGDVCVNVDDRWFAAKGVPRPTRLDDLADPRYKDLLVVQNPATSSPGLAFLLATVARYGEDGYLGFWQRLRDNGVKVVNGWTEAYEGEFSAGGKGDRPLVVSYASSPPATIVYAPDPKPTAATTSVMTDGCFRQIEYAGVLRGTEHPEAARAVVDWLLSPPVQADVPLSMFVFPARQGVPLPDVFTRWAAVPSDPLSIDPARIDERRAAWVDAWTQAVLR